MTTSPPGNPTEPQPRISVALCTWNGAAHLTPQLDSILAQQGVELELVVLDDASTDNTWDVLQERARSDPRIRLFRNASNLGHLRSFEKCMALGLGAWIAPADQDDVWHLDKLSKLQSAIGPCDLAYCDSEYMDADGASTGRKVSDDFEMFSGENPIPLFFQNTVSGHACLIRRDLLQAAGPAPEGFFHDWWLALAAAGRNGVVYVDEALVRFRRHEGSCTTIGRGNGDLKSSRRNSKWLDDLVAVGRAYSKTSLRHSEFAGRFALALKAAREGHTAPAWRLVWAHRRALPPKEKPAWLNAVELWSRIRRKSRRAQTEPAAG